MWQAALQTIVLTNTADVERSDMIVAMILILATTPRLFRNITFLVCKESNPTLANMAELIDRARKLRVSLQNWHSKYIEPLAIHGNGVTNMFEAYCRVFILFFITSIYSNRLSTCVY